MLTIIGFTNLVTYLIAVTNIGVRFPAIILIKKIGYDYDSQQIAQIMKMILYVSYFLNGLLLLLCNANFSSYFILNIIPARG